MLTSWWEWLVSTCGALKLKRAHAIYWQSCPPHLTTPEIIYLTCLLLLFTCVLKFLDLGATWNETHEISLTPTLKQKNVVYIYSTCWRCIRRCLCRRYNTVSKQTVRVTSVMFPSSAEKLLNHSWSFGLAFGKLSTNFTYNQPLRHSQTQETQPFTTFNKKKSKATDG